MIRINIENQVILLPSKWEELSQAQAEQVLEWRHLGMRREVFFALCLRMLFDLPTGWKYQILFFLLRWKWVQRLAARKHGKLIAKLKLIRQADEDSKMEILEHLAYLAGDVTIPEPPVLRIDVSKFEPSFFLPARVAKLDKDGASLDFETLCEAIHYYSQFLKSGAETDLQRLIGCLYGRVSGVYKMEHLDWWALQVKNQVRMGAQLMVLNWFGKLYRDLVQGHRRIFPAPDPAAPAQAQEDPFGITGFMLSMAGKQFGTLEETKRTCGIQVFDAIEVQLYNQENRKTA